METTERGRLTLASVMLSVFLFSFRLFTLKKLFMQANELRVGNYVNSFKKRHSEKFITVESISGDFINQDFRLYHLSDLTSLELTQDWILAGGFIQVDRKFVFENDTKFFIELDLEYNYCLRIKISKEESAFICQLNYVHQLQNIMFAIRGEELVF